MIYLVILVIVFGVVSLLNLVVMFAVLRYLRRQAAMKSIGVPAAGLAIPEFAFSGTAGETLTQADLLGHDTLVGFFSTTCDSCRLEVPAFVALARSDFAGDGRAVAVIKTLDGTVGALVRDLAEAARVIVLPHDRPAESESAMAAFGVTRWPSFYVVDEAATIQRLGSVVDALGMSHTDHAAAPGAVPA